MYEEERKKKKERKKEKKKKRKKKRKKERKRERERDAFYTNVTISKRQLVMKKQLPILGQYQTIIACGLGEKRRKKERR